ncbi:MAG: type IV secretion system DNA-binding domain-containing protein [Candidatus Berkelbacteria bacterium]
MPTGPIDPHLPPASSTLPSISTFQGSFLTAYTPSPNDNKFALDLLHAIQNHTPLTLLQKIFLVVVTIPGPIGWKLSFFNFISSIGSTGSSSSNSLAHFLIILAVICIVLILLFLLRKFGWRFLVKKQPLIFLELTFPSITTITANTTEQLFTLLHSLATQQKFIHKIIGHKKQYALEIVASKEQGIRYILTVPDSDSSSIQKSLLSYLPGLKINKIKDYLPADLNPPKKNKNSVRHRIIELKLSNDYLLPLQESKTLKEHDPIAYLTGNMTKLEPDELMVFQVVVSPITKSSHSSVVRHINKIKQRIYNKQTLDDKLFVNHILNTLKVFQIIFIAIANFIKAVVVFFVSLPIALWDTKGESVPFFKNEAKVIVIEDSLSPREQELQVAVKEKIDKPMFETSLRLLICSDDKEGCNSRVSGFLASFGSLSSTYQALVLKGKSLFSLIQQPKLALVSRQISLSNNPILSASELTDIYHFPYTETTKTEDLVKSKNQPLPAPLSFKQTNPEFDNVFAKNSYGGTETVVGQTLNERRRHTYILGATGSGKTTLLSTMIYQDIINGKGLAVIDPHGQLVEKILSVIPKERINDVVWFAPDDDAYPIALNLLELPKDNLLTASQLQKQKSLVASSIISIIQKFYDKKFFGPRMEYVLRNTILTALETPDPTLATILDLLTNKSYRKEIIKGLENKILKDYWLNEFEKLGSMQRNNVISPITNKIGGILGSPINYNILTQPKSTINFDQIMNEGKILLCDLSKGKIGEDESSFFGSLVIAKIQLAALKRAQMPEEERNDFFLYVDEFQNFATQSFSELVSEARKYRLATILAHQSISQIEDRDIIKVILANVATVICFKTANPEDEQFILPIFSPEVSKHEIGNLPLYNFYMKISVGQAQDTFLAQADNFTVKGSEKTAELVINESRKRYATIINQTKQRKEKPKEKATVKKPETAKAKVVKPRENKSKDTKQTGSNLLPRRE